MHKKIKKETIKRIIKWAKGEPQPPIRIDLEPTLSCNLKCKFCWQRSEERLRQCNYSNPLIEQRILEIVDEAAELGVLEWQIAGGWEPMVKPDFCLELMHRIKRYGMYGCLTTNGTLFTEKAIKGLVETGWDQILFSLEGPNAKIHDYLTGMKGSFARSVKAMSLFNKYKKELKTEKPVYSFHTVLTNKNFTQLKKMISWGYKLGTSGVCFEPINVWSDEGAKLKLSDAETKEFQKSIPKAIKFANELNVPTNLESLQEVRLIEKKHMNEILLKDVQKLKEEESKKYPLFNTPCFNPWLNLEIRISGHVVPCRLCDTHQYASKVHTKKLADIWHSPYFNRIRNQILENKLPRYCKTCASGIIIDFREIREELYSSKKISSQLIQNIKNSLGMK